MDTPELDRRRFLKQATLGAAGLGAGAAGLVGCRPGVEVPGMGSVGDYDVIEIGEGNREVFSTSEDDLSNTLIKPNGGRIRIQIDAGGKWANFGIEEGIGNGDDYLIDVQIEDASQHFTLENFYIGGNANGGGRYNGPGDETNVMAFTSIYHAGVCEFKRGFVTDWYQAYYCSNSGNPPWRNQDPAGAGGDMIWHTCYTEKFAHTAYRVGTDGGRIINCVAANPYTDCGRCPARSVWVYFNKPTIRNCDFATDIVTGSLHVREGQNEAIPTIENTRAAGGISGQYAGSGLTGEAPDLSVPAGVPTSAVEAASGTTSTTP